MRRALARCSRLSRASRSMLGRGHSGELTGCTPAARRRGGALAEVVARCTRRRRRRCAERRCAKACAQRVVAVGLQQLVQPLDVADPGARAAVDELGEVVERGLAELEQLLALEVALAALARDRGHGAGAVLGQRASLAAAPISRGCVASKRPATIRTRSR